MYSGARRAVIAAVLTLIGGCAGSGAGGTGGGSAGGAAGGAAGGVAGGTAGGTGGGSAGGAGGGSAGGAAGGSAGGAAGGTAGGVAGSGDAGFDAGVDAGHALHTVFIIVLENKDFSSIKGSSSAPYLNSLLTQYAYASNYKTPPGNHPSLPNYLWLEAGDNLGVTNDQAPATNSQTTTQHLVTLLQNAGISWRAYQEGITGTACPLTDTGLYAVRHDPMVYFDDVTDLRSPTSPTCIAHVRPYSELARDLDGGTVARYNFITPNICHDMQGENFGSTCPVLTSDLVRLSDTWLSQEVPVILASAAWRQGGVLFITWDEGGGTIATSDGPLGMIVISPFGKSGGYQNAIAYDHGSTLRTVQEIFGVSPLLRGAGTAQDLSDLFTTFP